MQTTDGAQLNLDALYKICPSCFTETANEDGSIKRVVDFNKLRALLGDHAEENAPESYDFTWVGKRAAQREAAAPIKKTLRPCPEESVDWENTQNLYIEGDNLEVLKLLQNSYMGKVKMIYIDPPYNTGKDFIYKDSRSLDEEEYLETISDESGKRLVKNTYNNGSFHSDWCKMIYSVLMVSRTLLKNEGVIFISIDGNEICNLKKICDEVFGESNLIVQMIVNRTSEVATDLTVQKNEYCLVYAKDIDRVDLCGSQKYTISRGTVGNKDQTMPIIEFPAGLKCYGLKDGIYNEARQIPGSMENIEVLSPFIIKNETLVEPVKLRARWRSSNDMRNFFANSCKPTKAKINGIIEEIYFDSNRLNPQIKKSVTEKVSSLYLENKRGSADLEKLDMNYFDFPKSVATIQYFVSLFTKEDDIVLDFFSGSGTTAHSVLSLNAEKGGNRKYILVQLQELLDENSEGYKAGYRTICDMARERIKRAGKEISKINSSIDNGFRLFRCDESNMKDVYFTPNDYSQGFLSQLEDNIKEDRTDLDLLFDCMLRWGVELSLPLSSKKVGACTIHNVNDGDLVACFDGTITDQVIDAIAVMSPLRVVFRDSSFEEASQKMNLFELFKQKCGWSDYEVKNNVKVI